MEHGPEDYRDCPFYGEHGQPLTRDEIDVVIRSTVRETLTTIGIEASNPLEMQRDFQTLREWRRASNAIRSKGLMTLIGIMTAGILGALWIGVKHVLLRQS